LATGALYGRSGLTNGTKERASHGGEFLAIGGE
jgi:hypothetical protein